jgi:hypothetical protein
MLDEWTTQMFTSPDLSELTRGDADPKAISRCLVGRSVSDQERVLRPRDRRHQAV